MFLHYLLKLTMTQCVLCLRLVFRVGDYQISHAGIGDGCCTQEAKLLDGEESLK